MLSSTLYTLFILEIVDYKQLGILLAVFFILQAVLDYPSGVLGDWVGQRWILAMSFIAYALSYSFLVSANSFPQLLIVYILAAYARSQESGALQSWFDNNYKITAGEIDPDREVYQTFQGKFNTLNGLLGATAFVFGGIIATLYFRAFVFAIQAIGMIILAGLCLISVKNFPDLPKPEKSIRNYFALLSNGIKFSLGSKYMLFFVVNSCLGGILFTVWMEMILFPMYYGYTGSDLGVALMRFIIWVINSLTALKAGEWSRKLSARKWIPILEFISTVPFFCLFCCVHHFFSHEG